MEFSNFKNKINEVKKTIKKGTMLGAGLLTLGGVLKSNDINAQTSGNKQETQLSQDSLNLHEWAEQLYKLEKPSSTSVPTLKSFTELNKSRPGFGIFGGDAELQHLRDLVSKSTDPKIKDLAQKILNTIKKAGIEPYGLYDYNYVGFKKPFNIQKNEVKKELKVIITHDPNDPRLEEYRKNLSDFIASGKALNAYNKVLDHWKFKKTIISADSKDSNNPSNPKSKWFWDYGTNDPIGYVKYYTGEHNRTQKDIEENYPDENIVRPTNEGDGEADYVPIFKQPIEVRYEPLSKKVEKIVPKAKVEVKKEQEIKSKTVIVATPGAEPGKADMHFANPDTLKGAPLILDTNVGGFVVKNKQALETKKSLEIKNKVKYAPDDKKGHAGYYYYDSLGVEHIITAAEYKSFLDNNVQEVEK